MESTRSDKKEEKKDDAQLQFKKALCLFYAKKFPKANQDKIEAFAQFILQGLQRLNDLAQHKSIHILTTSFNVTDGIGDFVNQADYTAWLMQVFKPYPNFQIRALSLLEAGKYGLAKKLMPDEMKKVTTVTVTSDSKLSDLPRDAKNFFCEHQINPNNPVIRELTTSADWVMNVARYFYFHPELEELLNQFRQDCFVQSRGEYGPLGKKHADMEQKKIYYENCMGVKANEGGVKFYPEIEAICESAQSDDARSKLLATVENEKLRVALAGNEVGNYSQTHGFGFGYIQVPAYSVLFARMMVAKSKDKDLGATVITNLAHFQSVADNKEFMRELKEDGYGEIQLLNNDGTVQKKISAGGGKKVLTLVEFRGTSQQDKEKMIAMADMVAGSGNSSFSEMLSAKRLPFIQPIPHVKDFYRSFLSELAEHKIENDQLLRRYLELNLSENMKEAEIQELLKMVSDKNINEKLLKAWQQYCQALKEKRNAYDDFIEMVTAFAIEKMLELDPKVEMGVILDFFPGGLMSGTSILHMAIEKRLPHILNNISKFQDQINCRCAYKDFTPLMMACRYQQFETAKNLLENKASLEERDSDGLTVVHQMVMKKDLAMLKLLAKYNPKIFLMPDASGNVPIFLAVSLRDKSMIEFFMSLDKNGELEKQSMIDGRGRKISLLEHAVMNLPPDMLHLFKIGADEKDIVGVATYAAEMKLPDLFSKCCEVASPVDKDKLKKLAVSDMEFAGHYIRHFREAMDVELFNEKFVPLILQVIVKEITLEQKVENLAGLQLELIKIAKICNDFFMQNGKSIDPEKLSLQKMSNLNDFLRNTPLLQRKINTQIVLSVMMHCYQACHKIEKMKPIADNIKKRMLIIKINEWLNEYEVSLNSVSQAKASPGSFMGTLFARWASKNDSKILSPDEERKKVQAMRNELDRCATLESINDKFFSKAASPSDSLHAFLMPKWKQEIQAKSIELKAS
jgi:ankyrin repeat protein